MGSKSQELCDKYWSTVSRFNKCYISCQERRQNGTNNKDAMDEMKAGFNVKKIIKEFANGEEVEIYL